MAGSPKGQQKVFWTNSEWQAVALALLKVRPDYIDHPNPILHSTELRAAMEATLPPERHRPCPENGATHFRPGLRRAYQFIRETMGSGDIEPALAAIEITPPAPAPKASRHKRVMWSDVEFLALAQHLRKRYPAASYIESSTCAGLHLSDVRDAMLATLPRERHRNLHTVTPLRKFFVTAFKVAKAEQYRENERAEREKLAASREVVAAPAPSAPAAATNPYEAVFAPMLKPLIGLLATELMAQLAPQITQLVNDAIAAALPQPEPEPEADEAPPDNVAQLLPARGHHPAAVPPPKKVMVGVVGPLPSQRNELERAFPHLHIVTLEGGNTNEAVARLRNARRVIGMTSFMNHSMDGALAKQFADRYMRVHGGVSSIKRQIKVWENSGVLAA